MRVRHNQRGFATIEAILAVVVLVVVGGIGWSVYHKHAAPVSTVPSTANAADIANGTSSSSQSPAATNVSSAPQINSASGLNEAINTLNQNDPSSANGNDSSQLNSQSNF